MIIQALLDLIYNLIWALTLPINIPNLPTNVISYINNALQYIRTGIQYLNVFFDMQYLFGLFAVVVAVNVGLSVYHVVMYIVKKIPMLGIK